MRTGSDIRAGSEQEVDGGDDASHPQNGGEEWL